MFCSKCGAMMDISHNFCSNCGQRSDNPLPPLPSAPPVPPVPTPDDDGDEAVLYRKGHAFYFTGQNTWVTGAFVIAQGYIVFYPIRLIKTFRIFFSDICAISDAFASIGNTRFAIMTKDGRVWAFSINTIDIAETQSLVDMLRNLTGIRQKFQPF